MLKVWVSPKFFEWETGGLNPLGSPSYNNNYMKAYKIWKYAQRRFDSIVDWGNDEEENLFLGDIVKNLKEVVEHREKLLSMAFHLANYRLPEKENNKETPTYKKLERLGIIKPLMLKKLAEFRNLVAHEQIYPSNKDREKIAELLEFTWYFLRSTDNLLARTFSGLVYYPPEFKGEQKDYLNTFTSDDFNMKNYPGCVFIHIYDYPNLVLNARNIPATCFSKKEEAGWLELVLYNFNDCDDEEKNKPHDDFFMLTEPYDELTEDEGYEKMKESLGIAGRRLERLRDCLATNGIVKTVKGEITGPQEILNQITRDYMYLYY